MFVMYVRRSKQSAIKQAKIIAHSRKRKAFRGDRHKNYFDIRMRIEKVLVNPCEALFYSVLFDRINAYKSQISTSRFSHYIFAYLSPFANTFYPQTVLNIGYLLVFIEVILWICPLFRFIFKTIFYFVSIDDALCLKRRHHKRFHNVEFSI